MILQKNITVANYNNLENAKETLLETINEITANMEFVRLMALMI